MFNTLNATETPYTFLILLREALAYSHVLFVLIYFCANSFKIVFTTYNHFLNDIAIVEHWKLFFS